MAETRQTKAICAKHNNMRDLPYLVVVEKDASGAPTRYECRPNSQCKPQVELVELCDLCQKPYKESTISQHIEFRHPSLLRFTTLLVEAVPTISQQGQSVSTESLQKLGAIGRACADAADGGPERFDFARRALEQARLITRLVHRDAVLFAFGSVMTLGVWDGDSDIDLTLVDPDAWDRDTWPPGGDEASMVKKLCRALRDGGFAFDDLEPVLHTRVPVLRRKLEEKPVAARKRISGEVAARTIVVRFPRLPNPEELTGFADFIDVDPVQLSVRSRDADEINIRCRDTTEAVAVFNRLNSLKFPPGIPKPLNSKYESFSLKPELFLIEFDMSCRAHGIRNSLLIRGYMQQSPLVRAGSVFVKKWSKRCGLNNSMRGFLTSYAVQMLWIYFLVQKRKVSFVPPESCPKRPDPNIELTYMSMKANAGDEINFERELGRLLYEFFLFYAVEFQWSTSVVSLSQNCLVTKEDLHWVEANEVQAIKFKDRVWYRFCIEDPYEDNLNLGRHLSPMKMLKVLSEFAYAAQCIQRGEHHLLLRDRTVDVVTARCRSACAEVLLGHRERQIDSVLNELYERNLADLAAFEIEYQYTKLFELAGVELDMDAGRAFYDKNKIKTHYVADREVYKSLQAQLKTAGPLGLALTPVLEALNLHRALLDVHDVGRRVFDSYENLMTYEGYFRIATSVANRPKTNNLENEVINRIKSNLDDKFNENVARAVLESPGWRPNGRTSIAADAPAAAPVARGPPVGANIAGAALFPRAPRTHAAPPPAAATDAAPVIRVRRGDRSRTGPCSGCSRKDVTWNTSHPDVDGGWYCDTCWREY